MSYFLSPPMTRSRSKDLDMEFQVLRTVKKSRSKFQMPSSEEVDKENVVILPTLKSTKHESSRNILALTNDQEDNVVKKISFVCTTTTVTSQSIEIPMTSEGVVNGTSTFVSSKKMEVSLEEKSMNGAPETDLYDVKLLHDDELSQYTGSETIQSLCSLYHACSVWADKYECVENIRRIVLFASPLSIDAESIINCMKISYLEIDSLRSSSSRNALYLLSKLVKLITVDVLSTTLESSFEHLFGKIRSGPKFLMEEASLVVKNIVDVSDPLLCMNSLLPYGQHKSVDVINVVYSSLKTLLDKVQPCVVSIDQLKPIFSILYKGLSSKSVLVKDYIKKSWIMIQQKYNDTFLAAMNETLQPSQVGEIQRLLSSSSSTAASSASVSTKSDLSSAAGSSSFKKFARPPISFKSFAKPASSGIVLVGDESNDSISGSSDNTSNNSSSGGVGVGKVALVKESSTLLEL